MIESELEKILERCNKATKGPWRSFIEGRDHTSGTNFIMTGTPPNDRGDDIELIGGTNYDQDFIANARQDIPKLIEEVKRLRKILIDNKIKED
jgi:hypothetical protein